MASGLTRREKVLGILLLVIIVINLIVLVAFGSEKGWFLSYRTYYVLMPEGFNLRQGSPVKMLNTEVGKVSQMQITLSSGIPLVKVTIKVLSEDARLIREKSVAEPMSSTPSGSEYLALHPGPLTYPPLKEHNTISVILPKSPAPVQ